MFYTKDRAQSLLFSDNEPVTAVTVQPVCRDAAGRVGYTQGVQGGVYPGSGIAYPVPRSGIAYPVPRERRS